MLVLKPFSIRYLLSSIYCLNRYIISSSLRISHNITMSGRRRDDGSRPLVPRVEVLEHILSQKDDHALLSKDSTFSIQSADGTIITEIEGRVTRESRQLKTGALAYIYQGTWLRPGQKKGKETTVCVKVLSKTGIDEQKYPRKKLDAQVRLNKRLNREVKVWQSVSHPRIVPLYGFKAGVDPWLVIPLYKNGDSLTWLQENPKQSKERVLAETAEAVQYLHSLGIVHADIKANNVLITDSGHAVLSDFGVAKALRDEGAVDYTQGWNYGCFGFIPPESIEIEDGWAVIDFPRDVYAMGGLIVQIYSGFAPFYELRRSPHIIVKKIALQSETTPRDEHPGVPDWAWELALLCWTKNPQDRPTINQVLRVLAKHQLSLMDTVRRHFG